MASNHTKDSAHPIIGGRSLHLSEYEQYKLDGVIHPHWFRKPANGWESLGDFGIWQHKCRLLCNKQFKQRKLIESGGKTEEMEYAELMAAYQLYKDGGVIVPRRFIRPSGGWPSDPMWQWKKLCAIEWRSLGVRKRRESAPAARTKRTRQEILIAYDLFLVDGVIHPIQFRKPKLGWESEGSLGLWKHRCAKAYGKRCSLAQRTKNPVGRKAARAKNRALHREKYIKSGIARSKQRQAEDPVFKFGLNVRANIKSAFSRALATKTLSSEKLLCCTISEFREYISSKLTDGMTLENHGEWHLDHIIPISTANAMATEEAKIQRICELNHYLNFQPLWASDNLRKADAIPAIGEVPEGIRHLHPDFNPINISQGPSV